ncbi:uncharacterized protein TRIVIDRAFT_201148 [Trichoderma virens Gv29-8]|uniref:Uncharacterized protein n=1 Tax=Hypocrea virens (strain Gv29-8 / FGSC 10586) TaxID=413071 RepID=G9MS10_HYPVG|nr:uncharacterized protein TRIVIDRAFT_201148 [Trichoderma virens Gv29-8]EHK22878.1 hypothetical protein TRIVIDRAFT_201148 [Trichoderma virens Gv29-8]UKZ47929.1 hypothetical protein TrVGV298_002164 [Trichoderma virens]
MSVLHTRFQINGQAPALISSTMGVVMRTLLTADEWSGYEPAIFQGPVQFNLTVAAIKKSALSNISRIQQLQEQNQSENQDEQKQEAFCVSSQAHTFEATLNAARDAVELSLQASKLLRHERLSQAFSAAVAIGGLSLATKSWKDTTFMNDESLDETTAMLYPGDKMQHYPGTWPFTDSYDIVTVRNDDRYGSTSYYFEVIALSISNASYEEYTDRHIREEEKQTEMVALPPEFPQVSVESRLLYIVPSQKPPFSLDEGSALTYYKAFAFGMGIYDSWYPGSY